MQVLHCAHIREPIVKTLEREGRPFSPEELGGGEVFSFKISVAHGLKTLLRTQAFLSLSQLRDPEQVAPEIRTVLVTMELGECCKAVVRGPISWSAPMVVVSAELCEISAGQISASEAGAARRAGAEESQTEALPAVHFDADLSGALASSFKLLYPDQRLRPVRFRVTSRRLAVVLDTRPVAEHLRRLDRLNADLREAVAFTKNQRSNPRSSEDSLGPLIEESSALFSTGICLLSSLRDALEDLVLASCLSDSAIEAAVSALTSSSTIALPNALLDRQGLQHLPRLPETPGRAEAPASGASTPGNAHQLCSQASDIPPSDGPPLADLGRQADSSEEMRLGSAGSEMDNARPRYSLSRRPPATPAELEVLRLSGLLEKARAEMEERGLSPAKDNRLVCLLLREHNRRASRGGAASAEPERGREYDLSTGEGVLLAAIAFHDAMVAEGASTGPKAAGEDPASVLPPSASPGPALAARGDKRDRSAPQISPALELYARLLCALASACSGASAILRLRGDLSGARSAASAGLAAHPISPRLHYRLFQALEAAQGEGTLRGKRSPTGPSACITAIDDAVECCVLTGEPGAATYRAAKMRFGQRECGSLGEEAFRLREERRQILRAMGGRSAGMAVKGV